MKKRAFGITGFEVSEIGFGAWGIGGQTSGATSYGKTDDTVSIAALKTAFDHGITFYDTARAYGDGHSEELIGQAFANCRHQVIIATKVGMVDFSSPPDFRPEQMRLSVEESLRRLKTDYIDVLQLHNPELAYLYNHQEVVEFLHKLREQGIIRAFGFSLKSPNDGIQAIETFNPDALQVNLNMMDVRACNSGLVDVAKKYGTALIARTPLHFGFLSGYVDSSTIFEADDHRSAWPRQIIENWSNKAAQIKEKVSAYQFMTPPSVALRFCLAFDSVACVIPGMLTPEEVIANIHASDEDDLSASDIQVIMQINAE